jgi:hypothetical protein
MYLLLCTGYNYVLFCAYDMGGIQKIEIKNHQSKTETMNSLSSNRSKKTVMVLRTLKVKNPWISD